MTNAGNFLRLASLLLMIGITTSGQASAQPEADPCGRSYPAVLAGNCSARLIVSTSATTGRSGLLAATPEARTVSLERQQILRNRGRE